MSKPTSDLHYFAKGITEYCEHITIGGKQCPNKPTIAFVSEFFKQLNIALYGTSTPILFFCEKHDRMMTRGGKQ